jgi:hypothetical protein
MSPLTDAVRGVLRQAVAVYAAAPEVSASLRDQLDRLDEPLRVAIAGKVKAGKSTLLNALVGELIAPTDAGECTKVVTWYRDAPVPAVVSYPDSGPPEPLAIHRSAEGLAVRLRDVPAQRLRKLVVDWPSRSLRDMTLIDTPGIASTSAATSKRTLTLLTPDGEDEPAEADAVVYLMRHLHVADAEFLESFRDRGVARASSVNTIAVVSRADEVGGGRIDAMLSARRIARRYRSSPALRGLCQTVLPVAGLLAATGKTLRQEEFTTLAALAAAPRDEMDDALLSTSRFLRAERVPASRGQRHALLARLGLYGLRLSLMHIRQGCTDTTALAAELLRGSGIAELCDVLRVRFTERRDLLKARSGLLAVERALRAEVRGVDRDAVARLADDVERISSGAHEFVELQMLSSLRSGDVSLAADALPAERLLGGDGVSATQRLALAPDAPAPVVRRAALAELDRWRRRAEDPFANREEVRVYRAVARSCEGIVAGLPAPALIR